MRENKLKYQGIVICIVALVLLFVVSACQSREKTYGAPLNATKGRLVAIQAILAEPAKYEGKNVIIQGKSGQSCLAAGCWLLLVDGADQLLVQFYNFTAKLTPGTPLRVQGIVKIQNQAPLLAAEGLEVGR